MADIQLGSGSSSAHSHRSVQPSQTLNRRYVGRPSNLAIDEAAQSISSTRSISSAPSRLVNLRVHAADLQQLQAEQQAAFEAEQNAYTTPQQVIPKVVELGSIDREMAVDNYNQVVPPEDTYNQAYYTSTEQTMMPVATSAEMMQVSAYDQGMTTSSELVAYSNMGQPTETYDNTAMMPAEVDTQALAMNIAADYAAASLGASTNDTSYSSIPTTASSSIDTIAQAASEAIAAIRVATDPDEVAEQIASLQAFAENIRSTSAAPEMLELSDTIDKFVGVAMKSSKVQDAVAQREAKAAESVKISTAPASRPAVKKAATSTTPRVSARPVSRPAAKTLPKARPAARRTKTATPHLVADEDQALRNALRSVAAMDDDDDLLTSDSISPRPVRRTSIKRKGGRKRFALAFICATACVAAVVYFVGVNIPDISVKVAAMQTGIEAKYPSYIPRDFSLSDINSENGKITLTFKGPKQASFVLSEEKSSWDSTALLRNYVEPTWQDSYTTTHEQGITVYISGSNATWVNGGVLYKITTPSTSSLTNKQLRNIVTSL